MGIHALGFQLLGDRLGVETLVLVEQVAPAHGAEIDLVSLREGARAAESTSFSAFL